MVEMTKIRVWRVPFSSASDIDKFKKLISEIKTNKDINLILSQGITIEEYNNDIRENLILPYIKKVYEVVTTQKDIWGNITGQSTTYVRSSRPIEVIQELYKNAQVSEFKPGYVEDID